jgi:hypothetical protein
MHLHSVIFVVDIMERSTITSLKEDNLKHIFELTYKRPELERHYYSVTLHFDLPLMGVNKWCKKTMEAIVSKDWDNITKMFDEHAIDFARVYLLQTSGFTPPRTFSLNHFARDRTRYEVEAVCFKRGYNPDEDSSAYVPAALFIQYKKAHQNAGRRFDMRWNVPFVESTGFHLEPALREQEHQDNVDSIIGAVQCRMRTVFANPRKILEARSDDEDSEWDDEDSHSDSDEEASDYEMSRMSSNEMLEYELEREPDSSEYVEDMLDEAAALRDELEIDSV